MANVDFDAVLLAGPQGSGKGTQGRLLAQKLGFFFWEMGAILRATLAEGTPLAERLSIINQGILLPDDLLLEVVKQKIDAIPAGQGIVFDGIPRRIAQADFLLDYLKQKNMRPITLFIDLPREDSLRRMAGRAEKEGRADDTPEGIATRLRYYDEAVRPAIEYLRGKTRFVQIDGRPPVDEVTKNIDAALGLK